MEEKSTVIIFTVNNIDCAHCASKIEKAVSEMDEVEEAVLTFTTKKLRVKAIHSRELFEKINKKCSDIEPGCFIEEQTSSERKKRHHHSDTHEQHHHDEKCGCGHEHHHHHDEECGCGHEHHHHHDEECECGHEHHHHHDEECECGHEHHHHHDEECEREYEHHHHHDEECECGHEHHHHHDEECECGHEHHHHHRHDEECECGHDHHHADENTHNNSDKTGKTNSELLVVITGAVLFAAAVILSKLTDMAVLSVLVFAAAYLVLGLDVLVSAAKGIVKGRVFNEKFLMSLATLAAFVLRDYPEAVGVMLFYKIGDYFEDKAVEKSRSSIMDALDMRPEKVTLIENNKTLSVSPEEVEPGDVILIKPGERIALDGEIEEGESSVDTSSLTGEHVPETVRPGDTVLSGSVNINGAIKLKVNKPIEESTASKILESVENAAAGKPKLDRFISRFANIYTPVVVIIALITAVIPSAVTGDWHHWIYTAVTFLVISCPCAIVLSVPLTFFAGIGAGGKKGILFKSGSAIETMKTIKAVVMDKTGTVTNGTFSVNETETVGNTDEEELLSLCASAEANSLHPAAVSIVVKAKEKNVDIYDASDIEETAGMGIKAKVNQKTVICGNDRIMEKYGVDTGTYSNKSGKTDVLCAVDGKLEGIFHISDTIKPDSRDAIDYLKSKKIKTSILTGDTKESAEDVSKKTGVDEYFCKLMPQDKLSKMKELREKYGSVMFIGDGINDAPVLAGADVSAAMGSGADAAVEAADIVFMNPGMKSVKRAFQIADDTNRIAMENIVFALLFKAAVMIFGILGLANMWFAVFADTGVALICVLNSVRVLWKKYK